MNRGIRDLVLDAVREPLNERPIAALRKRYEQLIDMPMDKLTPRGVQVLEATKIGFAITWGLSAAFDVMRLEDYRSRGVNYQQSLWKLGQLVAWLEEQIAKEAAGLHPAPVYSVPRKAGWIYVIQSGEFIKIGFATDVAKRVRGLETGSPHPIAVLHEMRGTLEDEARFHGRFASYRVRGEWFRKDGDLAAWMEAGFPT